MPAKNVDIVLVVDASGSMSPCFAGLANHLGSLLEPLQGYGFAVRFGLVTHQVLGSPPVTIQTLAGDHRAIYGGQSQGQLFTSDPKEVKKLLADTCSITNGDERSLVALDCALDFPFGPISSTVRVVAMFSDEPIESGNSASGDMVLIPEIHTKIQARGVRLYAAVPESPAYEQLAEADGAEFEFVEGVGLSNVAFTDLLSQMGRSISASKAQGNEAPFQRALFGQDSW